MPAIIGVHDFEKHAPQDLFIDIALDVDVNKALDSDDLADTVDYDGLCKEITSFVAIHALICLKRLQIP